MAANGKASGSLALIAAVPRPWPAAPIVRPRATGSLHLMASSAAAPKLATTSPVSTWSGVGLRFGLGLELGLGLGLGFEQPGAHHDGGGEAGVGAQHARDGDG